VTTSELSLSKDRRVLLCVDSIVLTSARFTQTISFVLALVSLAQRLASMVIFLSMVDLEYLKHFTFGVFCKM
jgi:hypothetical protein